MPTLIATPSGVICSDETATKGNLTAINSLFQAIGPEWVAVQNLGGMDLSACGTRPRFSVTTIWLGHVEPSQATDRLSIGLRIGRPLSNGPAQTGPPMLHPWQTDTFDPGDPELIKRVHAGRRLHVGFHIGSNAHEVDGERWIHLHQNYPYPCLYTFASRFEGRLAYPLPESYGECPHLAMNAFVSAWNAERLRLWALEPPPEPEPASPPQPIAAGPLSRSKPPRKSPSQDYRDRLALSGAVPLPGLEPWTEFGRRG
jgi:hypothetical protein